MDGLGRIIGIDSSEPQLARAKKRIKASPVTTELRNASIRELPFDDKSIDGICMSQVLHTLPEDVREDTLRESCRVLVDGGFFTLIDWSRPRIGFTAAVWTPIILKDRGSYNWRGTYPELFKTVGLELITDVYLDSLNRCHTFIKA